LDGSNCIGYLLHALEKNSSSRSEITQYIHPKR